MEAENNRFPGGLGRGVRLAKQKVVFVHPLTGSVGFRVTEEDVGSPDPESFPDIVQSQDEVCVVDGVEAVEGPSLPVAVVVARNCVEGGLDLVIVAARVTDRFLKDIGRKVEGAPAAEEVATMQDEVRLQRVDCRDHCFVDRTPLGQHLRSAIIGRCVRPVVGVREEYESGHKTKD